MVKNSSTYDFPVEADTLEKPSYSPDFIKGHSEAYLLRIIKQNHKNEIESIKDYDHMKASKLGFLNLYLCGA